MLLHEKNDRVRRLWGDEQDQSCSYGTDNYGLNVGRDADSEPRQKRLPVRTRATSTVIFESGAHATRSAVLAFVDSLVSDAPWKALKYSIAHVASVHSDKTDESDILARFIQLADQWERETRNMSSPNAVERHPAYGKIIQLGVPVISLILDRMVEYPGFWFRALSAIAGKKNDPVDPSMYGNVQAMTDAWLRWGEVHGYIKAAKGRRV
jgi:hypothetical protein